MSEPFDAEKHCDAMAAAMELKIEAEWRDSVIANLKATHGMATLVLAFPLDDDIEPAPVFEA